MPAEVLLSDFRIIWGEWGGCGNLIEFRCRCEFAMKDYVGPIRVGLIFSGFGVQEMSKNLAQWLREE
jgi:hypothetical protein